MLIAFSACQNSHDAYVILIHEKADSLTVKAAKQLQTYWTRVFDAKTEIKHQKTENQKHIFIGASFLNEAEQKQINSLKDDAFYVSIKEGEVVLAGKESLGNLYAVNTFIEEQLGCIKLSATEDFIPKKEVEDFKDFNQYYEPAFEFRRILARGPRTSEAYREWYKLDEIEDWGLFVHTFHRLLSPDKYFEEHPEYFSLVNGRRLRDAQLCLSNPEVIDILIENLGKEIALQPEKKYWSVSQNDAYNYCECENCQKLYDKYGSVSGVYVEMANKIAETYPDKQISTLAYQYTRSAPQNIKPLDNVNIMFCSIECNRSQALDKDKRSESFVKDMKDWSALTSNIFMWDYVVQFKNYLTPFPNFHVLQPNIQFFEKHGVNMMFQQGSNKTWSDLLELKQYLIAKLLWNPNANVDSLSQVFIDHYYGSAAQYIKEYHQISTNELIKQSDEEFLNIYGYPSNYANSYLKPELMLKYNDLMDQAELAIKDDSLLLDRVKRARLPVDFAYVDIVVNNHFKELPAIINKNDLKEINPIILEKLNSMEAYAEQSPYIQINERQFLLKDYKAYVLNKLNLLKKDNLLNKAKVTLKTEHSETYSVGGAKAINDGLLGTLNYSENWLGFHGEDMLVQIEFEEEQSISEMDMNFLKAVNSWVFLPENIVIESSIDGSNYKEFKRIENDLSDQNYLVKSIPFHFDFDAIKSKYLRIHAKSIKECPDWHRGFGKPSWIFVDEIIVN
jgi:hypothetical protein